MCIRDRDWDCPDLRRNVGDRCVTDEREIGTVNEDCECEPRPAGEYDCPDLEANWGDRCTTADGKPGRINRECECSRRRGWIRGPGR